MKATEVVKIIGIIRTLCPTQKLDEHTPEAWELVLDDIRYDDAAIAVRTLYRERGNDQEWGGRRIEADDIIREVKRMRARRIDENPLPPPPRNDMTPVEYIAWRRQITKQIADGNPPPPPAALPQRDMSGIAAVTAALRDHTTDATEEQAS